MPPFVAASTSASQPLLRLKIPKLRFSPPPLVSYPRILPTAAKVRSSNTRHDAAPPVETVENPGGQEKEKLEVEEDVTWIKNKTQRLVKFTGSVSQATPGPRLGQSSMPWLLAVPLAFFGITFIRAVAYTFRKFSSPNYQRKELVRKNAMVCKFIDDLFGKGGNALQYSALVGLAKKTGFSMKDILRKYIRYALNEKPFTRELVSGLIQLRKALRLEESTVADILNNISARVVKNKGRVIMDPSGYSEQGFKRKLAVQALFGKLYYLSELPEFCSRDSSLKVKEIFGVAEEDMDNLRLHTLTEAGDMELLEMMVNSSESEVSDEIVDNYDLKGSDELLSDG